MANTVSLRLDAENKQIICEVLDASGAQVASYGSVRLTLGTDPGGTPAANPGTAMGKEIKLRETEGCDADGNPKYCMMLRSAWYSTALTSNPTT